MKQCCKIFKQLNLSKYSRKLLFLLLYNPLKIKFNLETFLKEVILSYVSSVRLEYIYDHPPAEKY